jgi:excisionase family DNA binding protein
MTDPTLIPEELWLARDVAKFAKLSERTIFTLTADGVIPCIRLGRSVRYRPAAVMEALRKLESGVAQ